MSVVLDIVRSYRAPRHVAQRRTAPPGSEPRALAVLMAGCAMMFVSRWPDLSRQAFEDPAIPLEARLGGALLGWLIIAPLLFYAIAGLSRLVLRFIGRPVGGYTARMALFWALLAASPAWLLNGLMLGFLGQGGAATVTGSLAVLAFLIFWGAGLTGMKQEGGLGA